MKLKSKACAAPYLVWMVAFIVAPLLMVIYFAFTDKSGKFTLENLSGLSQYAPVFMRSILLAAIATVILSKTIAPSAREWISYQYFCQRRKL